MTTPVSIKINNEYKNIKEQEIDLPDLTVLTGRNGSGKTNFLHAIIVAHAQKASSLLKIDGKPVDNVLLKQLIDFLGAGGVGRHGNNSIGHLLKITLDESHYVGNGHIILSRIRDMLNRQDGGLSEHDIINNYNYVLASGELNSDFFHTNLCEIFFAHSSALKTAQTEIARYKLFGGNIKEADIARDFIDSSGTPPWDLINESLKEAGLNYAITYPQDDLVKASFTPEIINSETNKSVQFGDLSSGEKILFQVASSLFNSKKIGRFPQLLLLDEIDASLHPEMIKRLFSILKNIFIAKYGIKVILTTHSPTSVAMADDESVYWIDDGEITKKCKKEALSDLLVGVDNIGILYDNKKQVFVESKYDVNFYLKLDDILKLRENTNSVLNFISSGKEGSGSSTQVKEIVTTLTGHSVPSIYGIIDWDKENKQQGHVFVLGEGERYSKENYTFDPLYLGILIVYDRLFAKGDEDWFKNLTVTSIPKSDNKQLQRIYDYVCNTRLKSLIPTSNTKASKLKNGFVIDTSIDLMIMKGHELAKEIFDGCLKLAQRYKTHDGYEKNIYDKVFKECPDFIYDDLCGLLEKIHRISMTGQASE